MCQGTFFVQDKKVSYKNIQYSNKHILNIPVFRIHSFITVLSFIMIMSVYGRFFKLYLYTAIAPVSLSAFAGEPSQSVGKSFIKSYSAVCLEGSIIVLACIIFSLFAQPRLLSILMWRQLQWCGVMWVS